MHLIRQEELPNCAATILVHVPVQNDLTGWERRPEVGCYEHSRAQPGAQLEAQRRQQDARKSWGVYLTDTI